MGFLSEQGALALASRLKAISDRCYDLMDQTYRQHDLRLQARWFPLLRLLQERGPLGVGEAAQALGLTHSAVSQLATRLCRDGWLAAHAEQGDRRRRPLALTAIAHAELKAARPLWQAMRASVERRLATTGVDVLGALTLFEQGLDAEPLPEEIAVRRRTVRGAQVEIVPFAPELRADFYRLNAEWLVKYYRIEPIDHAVLSEPETHILMPGGAIFFALLDGEAVGTCALMPESPGVYELTKMAVTEGHQGIGLGRRLVEAAIAEFSRRDGTVLFLESQNRLQAALKLYESVGFVLQPGPKPGSHYQRADVYMIYRNSETAAAAQS